MHIVQWNKKKKTWSNVHRVYIFRDCKRMLEISTVLCNLLAHSPDGLSQASTTPTYPRTYLHTRTAHAHAGKHSYKHLPMHRWKTRCQCWLKPQNGIGCLAQWFTSKSPLIETLLDAVGSADVEGLGDLLVHEALPVENVGHHHPQVEHLKQLGDGGHLHQIASALVKTACVQVLEHRLKPDQIEDALSYPLTSL